MWITSGEINKITENIILREREQVEVAPKQSESQLNQHQTSETCSLHSTDGNYGHGFMAPRDKG